MIHLSKALTNAKMIVRHLVNNDEAITCIIIRN